MRALLVFLTLLLFLVAMISYAVYLFRLRKPVSYFDLLNAAKGADHFAKMILILWNGAIICAFLFAAVSLVKFLN